MIIKQVLKERAKLQIRIQWLERGTAEVKRASPELTAKFENMKTHLGVLKAENESLHAILL